MILLVDVGNSVLKWGLLQDGEIARTGRVVHRGKDLVELLDEVWSERHPPDRVVVSNVAGTDVTEILSEWVEAEWHVEAEFPKAAARAHGVTNAYTEPERLGVDRWAALLAAHELVEGPTCIVDCGTALTLDVLAADGTHLGGLIVPGLAMMRRSLLEGTAGIAPGDDGEVALLARDTQGAVTGGTLYALVAFIDRVTADVEAEVDGAFARVITGGDAPRLLPLLSGDYRPEPHLVLKGLARFASTTE